MLPLLLASGIPALAEDPWLEGAFNPAPLDGDVVFPMPCGGSMVFRRILVPSEGVLADRRVRLGSTNEAQGYIEGTRITYVAGSFADADTGDRYFLLGKYEVTRRQHAAMMGECAAGEDASFPQSRVSWIDALVAAHRYTLWLRANAEAPLSAAERSHGFARLPTEAEWEYGARGGAHVSESEFQDELFPVPLGLGRYAWFAGDQSSNGDVQQIGLKQPNPVGLHDILGNVDEMAIDPFQLSKLDRLHGQSGGVVLRGGNFNTAELDLRTSSRQEVPPYLGSESRTSEETGFRLVFTSHVLTTRKQLRQIRAEWSTLGSPALPPVADTAPSVAQDPLEELSRIASIAESSGVKQRIEDVRVAFRASFQLRNEARDRAARARLRLGTFLCQKLRDDGLPLERLRRVHAACVEARGAEHERCASQSETVEQEEKTQYQNLQYYADTIVGLVDDYTEAVIEAQASVLESEFEARGLTHLNPVSQKYVQHVAGFRKGGLVLRARWLEQCMSQ